MIARTLALAMACAAAPPALAHDHYSKWKRPDTGSSCCSDQDCRPVDLCDHDQGVLLDGACVPIPASKLLKLAPEDGRAHACWQPGKPPRVFCVVLPELS